MCALCGALAGARHWSDAAGRPAFAESEKFLTPRRERLSRVGLLNRILGPYGLKVKEWGGYGYLLCDARGSLEIVPDLPALWPAVERRSGKRCDPLDEALLAALAQGEHPARAKE